MRKWLATVWIKFMVAAFPYLYDKSSVTAYLDTVYRRMKR